MKGHAHRPLLLVAGAVGLVGATFAVSRVTAQVQSKTPTFDIACPPAEPLMASIANAPVGWQSELWKTHPMRYGPKVSVWSPETNLFEIRCQYRPRQDMHWLNIKRRVKAATCWSEDMTTARCRELAGAPSR